MKNNDFGKHSDNDFDMLRKMLTECESCEYVDVCNDAVKYRDEYESMLHEVLSDDESECGDERVCEEVHRDIASDILDDVLDTLCVSDKTVDMLMNSEFHTMESDMHNLVMVRCVTPIGFSFFRQVPFQDFEIEDDDVFYMRVFDMVREIALDMESHNQYAKRMFEDCIC